MRSPSAPSAPSRRTLLSAAFAVPVLVGAGRPGTAAVAGARGRIRALEEEYPGRIGLHALHTGTGAVLAYRARERFALASTFKVLAVAAVLRGARTREHGLLDTLIRYGPGDLVAHSPRTERHLATGMTVRELCDAALRYSDNTAANLLLRRLGGPGAVTAFARALGDFRTRLDRWEPGLNGNVPGDPRDTTTPAAIAADLRTLVLGDALHPGDRRLLTRWLLGNTTGHQRIRAGLPTGWRAGDKTGTAEYGGVNDVAVAWPPEGGAPLVISVYTTRLDPETPGEDRIAADLTRIAVDALARHARPGKDTASD
ncbi:class A beta-lactamase, partial [Streptomyces flavofungini]|uniref:class A beta-lactamase n=1 Tax=Streptomyces flavofungini TaxID=68200 RepID=UPI0034E052EB